MVNLKVKKTERYCYINAYLDTEQDRVGKLGIVKYDNEKKAKVIYVMTSLKHANKGVATAMLNKAIELFGEYEISLNVIPMLRNGEKKYNKTVQGLTRFYEKFGFMKTSDPCLPTMIINKKG